MHFYRLHFFFLTRYNLFGTTETWIIYYANTRAFNRKHYIGVNDID